MWKYIVVFSFAFVLGSFSGNITIAKKTSLGWVIFPNDTIKGK